jgi:hypothetical protein
VDLQPDRTVVRAEIRRAPDEIGSASLTNLNPHINSWFLLTLDWPVSGEHESFHLENPDPKSALTLSANAQGLLRLEIAQNPCQLELGGDSAVLGTLEGAASMAWPSNCTAS